ncbi:MAG: hypothetical protein KatS3mg077_3198 [Candidatus Binatia bacterium]|nr:MAG: hypothetical protein KatS3mg077_3198 [Candidatus Binatia bacterium]
MLRPMKRWLTVVVCAGILGLAAPSSAATGCLGDCNRDGEVTVDEILRGVNIALGNASLETCQPFDRDGDGGVSVDEIVAAVGLLLTGCPIEPTWSPTPTPSGSPTPTPLPNRPPELPPAVWYRTYAGQPIALALANRDPDGDNVRCQATGLPDGATFAAETATILWTPGAADAGQYEITVECRDDGQPTGVAWSRVVVSVNTLDNCSQPDCDPAVGCLRTLVALDAPCCAGPAPTPLPAPDLPCPAGRAVWISEDIDGGFRALHDCDLKYVRNNAQAAAEVRFKFRARCLSLDDRIEVRARMDTATRQPMVEDRYRVRFRPVGPDLVESGPVPFEIRPPAPFFDMQDAEANLSVTLKDGQLQTATESLRLRLTFTPVPELVGGEARR